MLGGFEVSCEHRDHHCDIGTVCLEVAESEIVHDLTRRCDCRARCVEPAGETFEPSDPDEATRLDASIRALRHDGPAAVERRVDVLRPPERHRGDVPDDRRLAALVSGGACVLESAVGQIRCCLIVGRPACEGSEEHQRIGCAPVIVRLFEDDQLGLDVALDLCVCSGAERLQANQCKPDLRPCPEEHLVAARRVLDRRLQQCLGLGQPPPFEECLAEVDLELQSGSITVVESRRGALQKVPGTLHIAAIESASAGGTEPRGGAARKGATGMAELALEVIRLLQVVADHLVESDLAATVFLEPVGEALVQAGTSRLRQCLVCGFAAEQVTEAEGILACQLRRIGADQLLAHEGDQARSNRDFGRCQGLDSAAVKAAPLDRAALED